MHEIDERSWAEQEIAELVLSAKQIVIFIACLIFFGVCCGTCAFLAILKLINGMGG